MPRIPLSSQRRRTILRRLPHSQNSRNTRANSPIMNQQNPTVTLPTFPITLGEQTFYATQAPLPNHTPHSWLEMSLQGQALSFSAVVEGRQVLVLVQNLTFLAQVVSEGMRIAMETYNNHLWLSTVLQPPLSFPFPQIPFYHYPSWEMPLFNPLNVTQIVEPLIFPPFFSPHQIPEIPESLVNPWNFQEIAQAYHRGQDNARENSPQVVPDIGTSNPQVLPHHIISPLSPLAMTRGEHVDVREVEEAIALMRETRTKIGFLKEIKIIIFKERFEKKHILICPPHLLKSSIDIRAPRNPGVGNFVVILNPYLATLNPLRMERDMTENGTNQTNRTMNIIIWNCKGCNGDDFRRNFRSLIDWHKPPLVALVETKMQDHQPLLDNFPYTNMIQVPSIGSSGGLAILWDDTVFELEEISTSGQEIHAMVKDNFYGS
ncbi:hypothetical protein KY290_030851 [Solanum tuberosum]|uniref:Uncharacterized protein n=2 Tax=Solanum TaxID=4107 RepID=A0ABQ7U7U7_SOLTU|nr:hypothetical protein KY289_030096 [Solanum tuberosum]KAH0742858.1 hypothetical protein KY290_030851 [Solanum tuberosum]